MNVVTIFVFWLIALLLSLIQEGILLVVFRKHIKFRLSRIIVLQVVLMFVLFAFFFAGAAIDPVRVLASMQTTSYVHKHGPRFLKSSKQIKYVQESATSGYYLYKVDGDGTNQILKTTYTLSDETTIIKTERVHNKVSTLTDDK